jgi:hypothetical protein
MPRAGHRPNVRHNPATKFVAVVGRNPPGFSAVVVAAVPGSFTPSYHWCRRLLPHPLSPLLPLTSTRGGGASCARHFYRLLRVARRGGRRGDRRTCRAGQLARPAEARRKGRVIPSCGDLLPSPAGIAEVSPGPDGKESRQLGIRPLGRAATPPDGLRLPAVRRRPGACGTGPRAFLAAPQQFGRTSLPVVPARQVRFGK